MLFYLLFEKCDGKCHRSFHFVLIMFVFIVLPLFVIGQWNNYCFFCLLAFVSYCFT